MPPILKSIACLTFPAWGTAVAVGMIISFKDEGVTKLIILAGIVLIAFSSAPIINSENLKTGEKISFTIAYFFAAAIVVFILGLFLLCMHQCN